MKIRGLKKLDQYVLQNFLPLFGMTFFICLFVVLMQFLWRYIDEMVGKGLGMDVLGEMFGYAALTMVPMALPLAVLLAALMTFGNLGERTELTAMKSAGVSLVRVMLPLIWLMGFVAIGAFFFQNDVLPVAQTKMWTLLYSMKQKSPELEIPEGTFYDQISGYNIFTQEKDNRTGILRDLMIYDMSKGFDNASVILADSGRLAFTSDKTHLYLYLWQGETFENLKDAGSQGLHNVPYRREQFKDKELIMLFDANFNRLDEEGMRRQFVGKNIAELRESIDSINRRVDSIGEKYAQEQRQRPVLGISPTGYERRGGRLVLVDEAKRDEPAVAGVKLDVDSVFNRGTQTMNAGYINSALNRVKQRKQEVSYRAVTMAETLKDMRRHAIEMQKKFTLSLACIIFFFIGAPLGAIIRKGGIGVPIVVGVILFIFYYIIDNIGYKMAREGRVEVWQGIWLSSAVLLPLGIVLTWKAVNDSAVFNPDAYAAFFRRITGRHETRRATRKEVIINPADLAREREMLHELIAEAQALLADNSERMSYTHYWLHGYQRGPLRALSARLEATIEYMSDSTDDNVTMRLNDFPVLRSLWLYHPARTPWLAWIAIVVLPVGLPLYLAGMRQLHVLRGEVTQIISNANILLKSL